MKQTVFIMVDTQRQDMLSCYDKDSMKTPNLDRIADGGTIYTRGYTCQPVCGPARSAIFTGIYPHNNGMETNCQQLRRGIKTVGEYLSPSNIKCAYIGKWHLDGGDYFGYGKCADGFDSEYWYDMRNFLDELPSDDERRLSRKPMFLHIEDPKEEDTYAHRCCDRAISFLDKYRDKDFYLTLSLDEPHGPSVCPKRFFKQLREDKFKFKCSPNYRVMPKKDSPLQHRTWAKQHRFVNGTAVSPKFNPMFACNAFCDYEIGRVLDKIDSLGIKPMIIYTADHGDMFLSHQMVGKGAVMFDEITKIPYIIKNGGFASGVDTTPVSHIDILPTVLKYFGVSIPRKLQGEPLQDIQHNSERDVFIEFTRYELDHDGFLGFQPIRAIVNSKFKLVINLLTTDELYDMTSDPYEKNNLINIKEYSKVRNELHDRLLVLMDKTRDLYRGYQWHCRPWRKGAKPSYRNSGCERRLPEDDFVQYDYNTGLPIHDEILKR